MKFFAPLTLFLAAAVMAQDDDCDAAPIVESCLTSENAKVAACSSTDYDCLCAAYQAVATCYNNCPKDVRASPAQGQVTTFCQQASLYGSAALRRASETAFLATATGLTSIASASASATPSASRTASGDAASTSSASTSTSTPNMGVGQLARNTGGVLLAVAGVVAAVL